MSVCVSAYQCVSVRVSALQYFSVHWCGSAYVSVYQCISACQCASVQQCMSVCARVCASVCVSVRSDCVRVAVSLEMGEILHRGERDMAKQQEGALLTGKAGGAFSSRVQHSEAHSTIHGYPGTGGQNHGYPGRGLAQRQGQSTGLCRIRSSGIGLNRLGTRGQGKTCRVGRANRDGSHTIAGAGRTLLHPWNGCFRQTPARAEIRELRAIIDPREKRFSQSRLL